MDENSNWISLEDTYIWVDQDELSCYIVVRADDHASEAHRC